MTAHDPVITIPGENANVFHEPVVVPLTVFHATQ
jgi:hypothetical protein